VANPSSNTATARLHLFHFVWMSWGVLAVLVLVGAWYALGLLTDYASEALRNVGCILWVTLTLLMLAVTVELTYRAIRLLRCRFEPGYVARIEAELNAPTIERVRRALQTLLDHRGRPFGEVDPATCDELQVRLMLALYRVWWERFGDTTPDSVAFACKAAEVVERLSPAYEEMVRESGVEPEEKAHRDPELEKLPPLDRRRVVAMMQPTFEGTIDALVDAINQTTNRDDVRACRTRAEELFAALAAQTVERAWQARFDAAERRQPDR
jgi:hypothetical protein